MKEHKWFIYFKRTLVSTLVFAILCGSCYAIYLSMERFAYSPELIKSLIPSLVMGTLGAALPFIFEALAEMEDWATPLFVIEITVYRCIAVKIAIFLFFIIGINNSLKNYHCWETTVGTESYKYFVVGVFFFEIWTSVAVDMVRALQP
jgi:hypothetical protein